MRRRPRLLGGNSRRRTPRAMQGTAHMRSIMRVWAWVHPVPRPSPGRHHPAPLRRPPVRRGPVRAEGGGARSARAGRYWTGRRCGRARFRASAGRDEIVVAAEQEDNGGRRQGERPGGERPGGERPGGERSRFTGRGIGRRRRSGRRNRQLFDGRPRWRKRRRTLGSGTRRRCRTRGRPRRDGLRCASGEPGRREVSPDPTIGGSCSCRHRWSQSR